MSGWVRALELNAEQRDFEAQRHTDYLKMLKERIDYRLNACLCEMKPGYDDSIVGFNEAWDIVRKLLADEIAKAER